MTKRYVTLYCYVINVSNKDVGVFFLWK